MRSTIPALLFLFVSITACNPTPAQRLEQEKQERDSLETARKRSMEDSIENAGSARIQAIENSLARKAAVMDSIARVAGADTTTGQ